MRLLPSRAALAFLHDLGMTAVAFVLALYLRVGDDMLVLYGEALQVGLPVSVLIGGVTYRVFGLYRGIWRYASIPDLLQMTKAVTVTCLAAVLVLFLLTRLDAVPRSVPLIQWFVLLALLGGPRFGYRLFKDHRLHLATQPELDRRIPILLIGAGDAAELFIRSLGNDRFAAYRVVGVFDPKGRRVGRAIHGIPVLGGNDDLEEVVNRPGALAARPQRIVLTQPPREIDGVGIRRLLEVAERLGMTLSRLPSLTEFKDAEGRGTAAVSATGAGTETGAVELRPIAIEDLLGRPQAVLDRGAIEGLITGRRVLVTGAGGTIGGELCRQIAALGPAMLVLADNGEFNLYTIDLDLRERHDGLVPRLVLCDVRDRDRVFAMVEQYRPEIVFHAAALKHVPLVEENPAEGLLTNAIGTRNVADAARAVRARAMVLISTDKAVRPTSVMGAAKRIAEAYCQSLDLLGPPGDAGATRFMTVRFGNVLGSSGSVVPLFQRQLARGGPLTVTHPEMRRFFMTVREAVELVVQASAYGVRNPDGRGKIFVLDMGEPVRIIDLARQMIRLAGLRPDKDVAIAITGIRPGEKLYEEILDAAEPTTEAGVDGVFVAAPQAIDYPLINRLLGELEATLRGGDPVRAAAIVETIVPDYRCRSLGLARGAGGQSPG